MKRGFLLIAGLGFAITMLSKLNLAQWPQRPSWTLGPSDFSMSIALADLDNDGDLDLVTGNYSYPYDWETGSPHDWQADKVGAKILGYAWGLPRLKMMHFRVRFLSLRHFAALTALPSVIMTRMATRISPLA